MANGKYKHYHLEYKSFNDGMYHDITDDNGKVRIYTGIENARKGAAKFLKSHWGYDVVAIFGGRRVNPVAGVVKKSRTGLKWHDYYHDNKVYDLNDNGTIRRN